MLAGEEKQLGAEHPNTLITMSNMAGLCEEMRDYGAALELYERVLAGEEKRYGPGHKETRATARNLADLRRIMRTRGK